MKIHNPAHMKGEDHTVCSTGLQTIILTCQSALVWKISIQHQPRTDYIPGHVMSMVISTIYNQILFHHTQNV